MVVELVLSETHEIECIIALSEWVENRRGILKKHLEKVVVVSEAELKAVSGLTAPNKALALVKHPNVYLPEKLPTGSFSLLLDGVQDPGNMGTILRTADWFGLSYIFCSPECVDVYNPKVVQASMGAFLRVKTMTASFEDLKERFPAAPFYGAVLEGDNIFSIRSPLAGVVVLGNEGAGIADRILARLDYKLSIPGKGGAESLNVGVAAGIILATLIYAK